MVVTRPQTFRNISSECRKMSDNESEASFPDLLTREQMTDLDNGDILIRQHSNKRNAINQRFYEMNRQYAELFNLVLGLTQQMSSNPRERNGLNVATTSANSRCDTMTGVQNPQPIGLMNDSTERDNQKRCQRPTTD